MVLLGMCGLVAAAPTLRRVAALRPLNAFAETVNSLSLPDDGDKVVGPRRNAHQSSALSLGLRTA